MGVVQFTFHTCKAVPHEMIEKYEFMNRHVKFTTNIEIFARFQKDFKIFLADPSTNP